jgi:hypothetical protein
MPRQRRNRLISTRRMEASSPSEQSGSHSSIFSNHSNRSWRRSSGVQAIRRACASAARSTLNIPPERNRSPGSRGMGRSCSPPRKFAERPASGLRLASRTVASAMRPRSSSCWNACSIASACSTVRGRIAPRRAAATIDARLASLPIQLSRSSIMDWGVMLWCCECKHYAQPWRVPSTSDLERHADLPWRGLGATASGALFGRRTAVPRLKKLAPSPDTGIDAVPVLTYGGWERPGRVFRRAPTTKLPKR